jgi:hypothetical protein
MRPLGVLTFLVVALSLAGCGHYYRGAYRGTTYAHATGAYGTPPTVVVADGGATEGVVADEAPFVSSVVTASEAPSGVWSGSSGWGMEGSADGGVDGAVFVPVALSVPRLGGSVSATGDARGLLGLVGAGVRIDCDLCDTHDAIAALSLLAPLSGGSLGVDSTVVASGGVRLEASLAHDALPSSGGESAIVLRAIGGPAPSVASPVRIHLVIDASTSMESRWDEVIASALALVGHLRAQDELQIVVYSTTARVALAPVVVGNGATARAAIRGLRCGGRTNIESGLRAAYGALAPSGGSIVLVLSDGVPQGGLATPRELGALAAEARASMGATTITIGLGNEFHPGVLRSIARRGGGDFRIAPSPADLDALFVAELEAHAQIVARDVTLDVALSPGVQLDASFDLEGVDAAVSVGGGHVSVRIAALSAGETRSIVLPIVTAHASVVAEVTGTARVEGAVQVEGDRQLALGVSTAPVPAGALLASLDADLASVLVSAASAVENGDASSASAALRAHAERARLSIAGAPPALHARIEHTLAFAAALDALVPPAGWGARRQTAAAMLEWAGGL